MSLVDELRQVEQQIAKRLSELEPLVAEYNELRAVAERTGIKVAAAPETGRSRRSSSRRKQAAAKAPSAATRKRNATSGRKRAQSRRGGTRRPSSVGAKAASNGSFSGKRDEAIVKLVGSQPGITVAELGKKLSVDPTGLYRAVKRLEEQGHITKQGVGLTPGAEK